MTSYIYDIYMTSYMTIYIYIVVKHKKNIFGKIPKGQEGRKRSRVDPLTILVWIAWVHLHMDFSILNITVLHGWMNSRCRGTTNTEGRLSVIQRFSIMQRASVPKPTLFKIQLYTTVKFLPHMGKDLHYVKLTGNMLKMYNENPKSWWGI